MKHVIIIHNYGYKIQLIHFVRNLTRNYQNKCTHITIIWLKTSRYQTAAHKTSLNHVFRAVSALLCIAPYLAAFGHVCRQSSRVVARGRPVNHAPMLPNKSEDEPMVTKKKSKIPCLSLSSFLPVLEGTVHFVWPLFSWPRRCVAFTGLFALTFLSWSGVMKRLCNAKVILCSVFDTTQCRIVFTMDIGQQVYVSYKKNSFIFFNVYKASLFIKVIKIILMLWLPKTKEVFNLFTLKTTTVINFRFPIDLLFIWGAPWLLMYSLNICRKVLWCLFYKLVLLHSNSYCWFY